MALLYAMPLFPNLAGLAWRYQAFRRGTKEGLALTRTTAIISDLCGVLAKEIMPSVRMDTTLRPNKRNPLSGTLFVRRSVRETFKKVQK